MSAGAIQLYNWIKSSLTVEKNWVGRNQLELS